jgi:hypothetical protein
MKSNRWLCLDGSQIVYHKGLLLKGVVINCHASDGYSTLYDGLDATSGRKICRINGASKVSTQLDFGEGIRVERGLYVAFGDHTDQVIVYFDPFEIEPESAEA